MSDVRKEKFLLKLKEAIIECCNVKNVQVAEITDAEPIVGGKGKLQLDSLDALEVIMMVEQRFELRLAGDENARALFYSFDKMATYILQHAAPQKIDDFIH